MLADLGFAGILLCPAPTPLLECWGGGVFYCIWLYVGSRDLNFAPQALYPLSHLPGPVLVFLTNLLDFYKVLICNDLEIRKRRDAGSSLCLA